MRSIASGVTVKTTRSVDVVASAMRIRLTSGVVTDTPSTEPNEGHGPEVLYEVADHVATITLNRPHRRNAISGRMLELLSELLRPGRQRRRRPGGDPHRAPARASAPASTSRTPWPAPGIGGTGGGGGGGSFMQTRNLPTVILQEMDTPVIAVLNGAAAGYGLDLALGADLRLMASSAKLLPGFAKRGVVPESGGTWYLPRLLGWAKAAEISYLGRDIDAAEAERIGLVNRAVPDDELARRWPTSGPPRSPPTRRWPSGP